MHHFIFLVVLGSIFILYLFHHVKYELVTYDFYFHLFSAKHYATDWFSLYEPKLAGGFNLSTYPPLTHQLIALLSFIFPFEISGYIITIIFWILLSYFVSKFSIEFLNLEKNMLSIIFIVCFFSVGVLKTIFIYGQITNIVFFAFYFASTYFFIKCIKEKNNKNFIFLSLFLSLSAFSHIYFFLISPIFFLFLTLFEFNSIRKKFKLFLLTLSFSLLLIILGLSPLIYNRFFRHESIPSTEIPHGSRCPLSSRLFIKRWIFSTFGLSLPLFFTLPLFFILSITTSSYRKNKTLQMKLFILATIFLIIGLGHTTSIPKILFPKIHYWITYDKFLLFSSLLIAPLLPVFFEIKPKNKLVFSFLLFIIFYIGTNIWLLFNTRPLFFGNESSYRKERENAKDYIIDFLNKEADINYRYQTFGFAKPINEIYFYSRLPTLDTDYFTGRRIEWINSFGIEEIDSVKNTNFLKKFMENAENYSVKYIITIDGIISDNDFYFNFIKSYNWTLIHVKNFDRIKVAIWEIPKKIDPVEINKEKIGIMNYLWGIIPILTLLSLIFLKFV